MSVREPAIQQSQEFPPTDPEAGRGPVEPEMLSKTFRSCERVALHPWMKEGELRTSSLTCSGCSATLSQDRKIFDSISVSRVHVQPPDRSGELL
ncbi:UNVERIFIED_CONTAM: hypothetical protein PYX00_008240 [Menopon gallinae]|uniref:Uncharacterized protein n=1 Tax=Menopon gallinae TaxID=328185 RepID=A0AAW2HMG6_9NEOP